MQIKTSLSGIIVCVALAMCSHTLAEDVSPEGAQMRKEEEIRIVVMGDSLSAAYYIPLESGWVHLLQQRLVKEDPISVKVINSSISGATTAAGLQTLPVVLQKQQPHIVVLEMGGNDGLQGKPLPLIKGNLEKLIQLSLEADARVLLVGMRLPPNLGARYTEPFFSQYAELAEQYRIEYVPFLLEGVAGDSQLMQGDGIHPTAEAQMRILENVWPTLNMLLNGIRNKSLQ